MAATGCHLCGRRSSDPMRGEAPWHVGVVDGEQVLTCPDCQRDDPTFSDRLATCESCGSNRLSRTLGVTRCRACGHSVDDERDDGWLDG